MTNLVAQIRALKNNDPEAGEEARGWNSAIEAVLELLPVEPSGDGLARQCDKLTEQLARAQKAITSAMDALSNGRTDDGARILRECFWLGDKR